jgi:thymidine phosphorylase
MRADCHVCRAEGLASHARGSIAHEAVTVLATLYHVQGDLLRQDEAVLLKLPGRRSARPKVTPLRSATRPRSIPSVRAKTFGHRLEAAAWHAVICDIPARRYGDVHLAALITACADTHLDRAEMADLTRATIEMGEHIDWGGADCRQTLDRRARRQPHLADCGRDRRRCRPLDPQNLIARDPPRRPAPPTRWRP